VGGGGGGGGGEEGGIASQSAQSKKRRIGEESRSRPKKELYKPGSYRETGTHREETQGSPLSNMEEGEVTCARRKVAKGGAGD